MRYTSYFNLFFYSRLSNGPGYSNDIINIKYKYYESHMV